ncbi:carbohydrate porin [Sphaerotilus sp.]|uniref:carbohydrate porin n=1 Tax=Sphaerotilus sp. TaxID=2093942 RepID=UPI002ACEB935|nr:carbohydrate porin [Sphaerotilus sp.]MDZ7857911.1 carbohydrate porin [Sphaerotilus sp.]
MIRKTQLAVAAAALIAAPAFAAVGFDANVEMDTTYQNNSRGASQSGRVELNAFSKTDKGGGFVAGRASYLATKGGTAAIDDMWVQIGNSAGDIKLGRFEAADLFPAGKDVIVEDGGAASGYRTNVFRGRTSAAHAALTVNAGSGVGFELGVMASAKNTGVRPVVSFGMNGFSAKVGLENGKNSDGQKVSGAGITVGTTMAGAGLNLSVGSGKVNGVKGSSFGVNATFGPAGVGYILDKNGSNKDNMFYAAYSLPLFDTGATLTPAVSYAKGTDQVKNIGLRVRVNYAF